MELQFPECNRAFLALATPLLWVDNCTFTIIELWCYVSATVGYISEGDCTCHFITFMHKGPA